MFFRLHFHKDESTNGLVRKIVVKDVCLGATVDALKIQSATVNRWLNVLLINLIR